MNTTSRRTFLKLIASSAGLCATGFCFAHATPQTEPLELEFKLFTLHPDNRITIYNSRSEMGQGVSTSLSQLLMEELNADWAQIKEVKNAWADKERFGHQNTIGAISNFIGWDSHRQAGGLVKLLLRQTAANIWQIGLADVEAKKGVLYNLRKPTSLTYGQLCHMLQHHTLPDKIELKNADTFTLIGKSMPRLDLPDKIAGKTLFGIDQNLPDMKVAVVARCPVFGGALVSFDDTQAKTVKGIVAIFAIHNGVAIIANNYWQAHKAREKLQITWNYGDFEHVSSTSLLEKFKAQLEQSGKIVSNNGDVSSALKNCKNTLVNDFHFPLVAHMTMEPMNCTVWNKKDQCLIWAPTQNPNDARDAAAKTLERKPAEVTVNVTFMGGGFGRRSQDDFVVEACEIAKQSPYPLKLIWSREDDLQHDFYRPLNYQRISACLSDGKIQAWQHKVATLATSPYHFSLQQRGTEEGNWVAYGGSESSLYQIEHFQTQTFLTDSPLSVGILRGISHGYVNFASEVTIDELAQRAGQHPIDFRLTHIQEPRARNVLKLLKAKIAELTLSSAQSLGIAFGHEKGGENYQYYNAVAAIVEKDSQQLKMSKVILVLDHGQVINPDGLKAQAEGSVVFALSMLFQQQVRLEQGRIVQSNFHDYPVARMGDECEVELHTTGNHDWPMGTGEKLQGTIQPAIANALARATGKTIRSIPINLSTLAS